VTRRQSIKACQDSIESLPGSRSYLWTFTFSDCIQLDIAAKACSELLRRLSMSMSFYGVRCFELHPGGHGLHMHVACSVRYDVNQIRKIALALGFGRINVQVKSRLRLLYISKYLGKQGRVKILKGVRLWAVVGKRNSQAWVITRCKDIDIESELRECAKKAYAMGYRGVSVLQVAAGLRVRSIFPLSVLRELGLPLGRVSWEEKQTEL